MPTGQNIVTAANTGRRHGTARGLNAVAKLSGMAVERGRPGGV